MCLVIKLENGKCVKLIDINFVNVFCTWINGEVDIITIIGIVYDLFYTCVLFYKNVDPVMVRITCVYFIHEIDQ